MNPASVSARATPRERAEGIAGGQWAPVAIHEPGHRLRQFLPLREGPQRAEVRRFVTLVVVLSEAAPDLLKSVLRHNAPLDQLGGIWEIPSRVTLPRHIPTVLKRSF